MPQFNRNTLERHTDLTGQYLPDDPLFAAKNRDGSALRRTLKGVSESYQRAEDFIVTFIEEYNLLETEQLIDEWEAALGIPGSIFVKKANTLQERRNQVLILIRANGAQIDQDFIDLAFLLGFDITIEHLKVNPHYLPKYDVPFCIGPDFGIGVYTWIIRGDNVEPFVPPYDVPFIPSTTTSPLNSAFLAFKPIHTHICFVNTGKKTEDPCPPVFCSLFTVERIEEINKTFGANFTWPEAMAADGLITFTFVSILDTNKVESINMAMYELDRTTGFATLVDSEIEALPGATLSFSGVAAKTYFYLVQGSSSNDVGGDAISVSLDLPGTVLQNRTMDVCGCQGDLMTNVFICPIVTEGPTKPPAFNIEFGNVPGGQITGASHEITSPCQRFSIQAVALGDGAKDFIFRISSSNTEFGTGPQVPGRWNVYAFRGPDSAGTNSFLVGSKLNFEIATTYDLPDSLLFNFGKRDDMGSDTVCTMIIVGNNVDDIIPNNSFGIFVKSL